VNVATVAAGFAPVCVPCVLQLPVDCVVSMGCGSEPQVERSKGLSSVSTSSPTSLGRLFGPALGQHTA
jgi:hypothetical protein